MALVTKIQKQRDRKKQHKTHYDSIYDALLYLWQCPIPLTIYRISTNRNVLSTLLTKELIYQVNKRDLLVNSKYENVMHYVISPKGIEFIKRYESLQQLLAKN
jgi:predicted transcriptional regulator